VIETSSMAAVFAGLSLAYQLAPAGPACHMTRSTVPAMQYQLNNYLLDGPLQPLGNQVLVKLNKVEEKTDGGLFVPTAAKEKPKEGVVVAAGPGVVHPSTGKLLPNSVSVGDTVMLTEFDGEKVDYNSEKHIFVDADDVLGSFEGGVPSAASFRPNSDRLLVKLAEAATETSSGIALAATEDDDSNQGEVVAVGSGKMAATGEIIPVEIAAGDKVLYPRNTGFETTFEGKKFKIVFAADCMAKW